MPAHGPWKTPARTFHRGPLALFLCTLWRLGTVVNEVGPVTAMCDGRL